MRITSLLEHKDIVQLSHFILENFPNIDFPNPSRRMKSIVPIVNTRY
jgi:hypothetical protein